MKPQNVIIPLHIYPFDVMVSFNQTDAQLGKVLDQFDLTEGDRDQVLKLKGTVSGRCAMFSSNQTCIRLVPQQKSYAMHAVISHEVFHAVTMIMDRVGMKLELTVSCEAYAYLVGYLTKEIYKRIDAFKLLK